MLKFRPRYSLRSLLVVVTLVAIGCWLWVRSREFEQRANRHLVSCVNLAFSTSPLICLDSLGRNEQEHLREYERIKTSVHIKADIHRALSTKYRRAAKYPWLPVEPDPPGVKFFDKGLHIHEVLSLALLPNSAHAVPGP